MCRVPNHVLNPSALHGQGSSSDDNVETGWMQLDFDMKLVSGEIVALARILGLGSAILIMASTDLAHPQ